MTEPTISGNESPSFEESLDRIRNIVTELEGGQLSLDQSIEKFRDGSQLIEHTRRLIADAELRITELSSHEEA